MRTIRSYWINNPSAPLEPAGRKELSTGVVRTVYYNARGTKLIQWDYRNDKHR